MLASKLFCLHRAASRDAALFKENFYSFFFFFPAVSHFLYLLFMVLFSSSILHAAASDRDYFKASYNGLLIYLAKMRKLAPHWPLVS